MIILISGASTGIGRATALHLAALGHEVWAGVRNQKSFDDLGRKVRGLHPVFLDVTKSEQIASAVSEVKKKAGMLNALINNAGIAVAGPIEGLGMEDWRRQFDINFFGQIELTKACLPLLRESKGRILNMSSVSGRISGPFMGPYSASKFALEAFSDALRREVQKYGVKVSVIEPGPIRTPIWEKSIAVRADLIDRLSEEIKSVYGESLEKFVKNMEQTGLKGDPVEMVVRAVEHALLSPSPRTRYPVGRGIGSITKLVNVMPDKWMDRLLRLRF